MHFQVMKPELQEETTKNFILINFINTNSTFSAIKSSTILSKTLIYEKQTDCDKYRHTGHMLLGGI